jgi:hypothetical protein
MRAQSTRPSSEGPGQRLVEMCHGKEKLDFGPREELRKMVLLMCGRAPPGRQAMLSRGGRL